MRYRAHGVLRNPGGREIGRIGVTVKAKTKSAARGLLGKILKRTIKNVAAGFMDEDGIFHPIRASHDYSPSRAGESRRAAKKARKGGHVS